MARKKPTGKKRATKKQPMIEVTQEDIDRAKGGGPDAMEWALVRFAQQMSVNLPKNPNERKG